MAAAPGPLQPGGHAAEIGADPAASEVASSALRCLAGLAGQLNLGDDIVKVVIDWSKLQSTSALQPTLLFSALQQHILCLQPLLEKLQSLIKEENIGHVEPAGKTEGQACEKSVDVYDGNCQMEEKYASYDLGDLKDAHINFDPEVVQIKAGKAEIDRRISAFIERKQAEINENNVREFCNVIDCNQENSCARTDAIFTPYPGFKSHIKVSRVVNTYGPQTRSEGAHGSSHKTNVPIHDCGNQAVEERLQNIEAHLRLQTELFWQEEKGSTSPRHYHIRESINCVPWDTREFLLSASETVAGTLSATVQDTWRQMDWRECLEWAVSHLRLDRTIHWLNLMKRSML
ncbi:MAP3K12-binding inhibitory protein 1 isoform X1 [Accipiter gentilis]|uniref:MAP3K12-binding inhibitory protein 1 isoform X1 n=1 Tax=Astur gentilis TaxID=8957 RepID=UPI00210FC160|nr:MAP3K12-binding inhibitory protein 1 isoform X1 [Accipiter gentilis]